MGIIGIIKGLFIALLILMLVTAVPMLIFTNSIKSTLLQQSFYQTQFDDQGIYIKAQGSLLDALADMVPSDTLSTLGATKAELRASMAQSITKDWVKGEMDRLVQNVLWYMKDETKGVNLSVSIRPKIVTGVSQLVATKLGVSASDAESVVGPALADSIPDPLDLASLSPQVKPTLAQVKSFVSMFMMVSGIVMIAVASILMLILLLTLDFVKFSRTVGWPMLVTGIGLAVSSFMIPGTLTDLVSKAGVPQANAALTVRNVVDLFRPLFGDVLTQALMLFGVGVLLIAFSFVYPMVMKTTGNDEGKRKK